MAFIARLSAIIFLACALASCGGGGGGGGGGSHSSTPVTSTGSGSGTGTGTSGGSGTGTTTFVNCTASAIPSTPAGSTAAPTVSLNPQTGTNVAPISVNAGCTQEFPNVMFVTVTVCAATNATNCVSIPNVQVDTGSVGLRVLDSFVQSLNLTPVTNAGSPVGECAQFADGSSWGAVRYATVSMGGLTTTSLIPIQVVDDQADTADTMDESSTPEPTGCKNDVPLENTLATLGANGVIGVGYFLQDCGSGCAGTVDNTFYYTCPANNCNESSLAVNLQVSNPVSSFPTLYNNGNIIELPTVPDGGASVANGYLVFGVGTTSNNSLPTGIPLGVDATSGDLAVAYNSTNYPDSFIDSGSSVYFFNSSITACGKNSSAAGFYCPSTEYTSPITTISTSTTNSTVIGGSYQFTFNIGNAISLFDSTTSANGFAFNNLGATETSLAVGSGAFDVGAPFFFGKSIYTVIEGQSAGAYTGPFAAVGPAS